MKSINLKLAVFLVALLTLPSCGGGGGGSGNNPDPGNGNTGDEIMIQPPPSDNEDNVETGTASETWRGLTMAPENRCSPYDRERDYPYSPSVEEEIVHRLGRIYGPYTGTCFSSTDETEIEHIVATSEAHDSGRCARDRATRASFARDLRNLTLAAPRLNRQRAVGMQRSGFLRATDAGSRVASSKCAEHTGSPSTSARRTHSTGFSPVAALPPWSLSYAIRPRKTETMHSLFSTTMAMDASPAARRTGTALHPCPAAILHTDTCGMVTATGSFANELGYPNTNQSLPPGRKDWWISSAGSSSGWAEKIKIFTQGPNS